MNNKVEDKYQRMTNRSRKLQIGDINQNTYGTLMKIIAYRSADDIDVEFLDSNHYIKEHTTSSNFNRGGIKNPYDKTLYGIGYLGDGKFKTSPGTNRHYTEYDIWHGIIERCYIERKHKYKAYYGTTEVCDEWLNYQNFAQWYHDHYYDIDDRLEVDKDIKYPCNKVYSPHHCLLVPQKINMLFMNKPNKRGLPNGIREAQGLYYAKYNHKELGKSDTLMGAYKLYADAKKEAIVAIANKYRDKIPDELYQAMLNYEIKIENDKNYIPT